jgi:hypothetical protein
MCIFLFHIIIHIPVAVVTVREEVVWVMEGAVCAEDYTILWENKLPIDDRIFCTS